MNSVLTRVRGRGLLTAAMPAIVLIAMCAVIATQQSSFFQVESLGLAAQISAPIILLALGQSFVILTGGIDLSQAVLASFSTVLVALWLPELGPAGVFLAVAAVTVCGMINGVLVSFLQVPSFIVTLGAMSFWGAIALVLSGASTIPVSGIAFDAIAWLSSVRVAGIPIAALLCLLLPILVAVAMKTLTRGNVFHAVGLTESAAQMAGLRTRAIRVLAFGLSGLLAGLSGVLLVSTQYSGSPTLANTLLLPAIAAVIIGGTAITGGQGGPVRTLVGALVIAVLRVGMGIMGVDPAYEQIVYGVAIIGAVALTIDRSKLRSIK